MKKGFINFIKDTFASVNTYYLVRQYFFGILILILFYMAFRNIQQVDTRYAIYVYLGINFIFYPFATLVWDELKALIMGDSVFFMNAIFLLTMKLIIKIMIFYFAIFIGIIAILYLWFLRKINERNNQNSQGKNNEKN